MKKMFFSLLIPVMLFISYPLSGQESDTSSSNLNVLESLAKSNDGETKGLALDGLKEQIDQGMGEEESKRVMEILTLLANEGITSINYEGSKKNSLFPNIRERAAKLLGETKDPRALNPLINIIFYDDNAQIIITAIQAISNIMPDKEGKLAIAYARILKNTRLIYNNEELIQFTLESVSLSGSMDETIFTNQELLNGLDFVSQSFAGYGRATRDRANEVLNQADSLNLSSP